MDARTQGEAIMVVTIKEPRRASRDGKYQRKHWLKPVVRLAIYLRDGFRCAYCMADLHGADYRDLTVDHVQAKEDGGSDDPSNLILACRSCNCSKQNKPLSAFAGPETIKYIRTIRRRSMTKYLKLAKDLMEGTRKTDD